MANLLRSSSESSEGRVSQAFDLLHPKIQKWAWTNEWQKLRMIQEEAILAILSGPGEDLILSAPTAGGKTEAVYMPILTELAAAATDTVGFKVLYISPLRALIDDQFERISEIANLVDVPVTRWHGDVSGADKARALRSPAGIILTTPESLEAFFVLRRSHLPRLFGSLKYLIVDELHAFMPSERGRQLQSLMNRLDLVIGSSPRRIALSATIGDVREACAFLRPPSNEKARAIVAENIGEIRIAVHGFVSDLPEGESSVTRSEDIPEVLYSKLRGGNNLVFANTRQGVESLSDTLRRLCEKRNVPNEFYPHHGSLSKDLRKHAEAMLKKQGSPATVICTSTLELGIDVGHIESIAQMGSPPSVSSVSQRLGRSGRRDNPSILRYFVTEEMPDQESHLEDHLHLKLIEVIAQTELLLAGWCESPETGALHLSTLLHQILSLICERGGITAKEIWTVLCSAGPFRNVSQDLLVALLRQMGAGELIEQAPSGILLLGRQGERLQSGRDFYAVFFTPDEFTLISPAGSLGSLPIRYPLIPGQHLIFGGTRWLVESVDLHRRVVMLHPSPAGKVPKFAGGGWLVGDEVRKRMRQVLLGEDVPRYLDACARQLLSSGRRAFQDAGLHEASLIEWGGDTCLFCWRGDRIRFTLKALLSGEGLQSDAMAVALNCRGSSKIDLIGALEAISSKSAPNVLELASKVSNKENAKYDGFLGKELLDAEYASRVFEIEGAKQEAGKHVRSESERSDVCLDSSGEKQ